MEKKYKWRRKDYQEKTRGLLMVHTGNGKETTCARSDDARRRTRFEVLHDSVHEVAQRPLRRTRVAAEKLGIEVHTMGDGFTWDTKNPEQDIKTARETWALCVEKLRSGEYDLLVFDELVYVLSYKMLPVEEVVAEFRSIRASQPALHIVVTGRDARLSDRSGRPRDRNDRDQTPIYRRNSCPQGIEFLNPRGSVLPFRHSYGLVQQENKAHRIGPA